MSSSVSGRYHEPARGSRHDEALQAMWRLSKERAHYRRTINISLDVDGIMLTCGMLRGARER
eukprot:1495074-Pleurochrysis_carterae.AAC.2